MNDEFLSYLRIVIYSMVIVVLVMFAVIHHDRSRRALNLSLALFFISILLSLIAKVYSGLPLQAWINNWLTTPILVCYATALMVDFYLASMNGKSHGDSEE